MLITPRADEILRSVAAVLPAPAAAIRISLDGFHRSGRERYRQGRTSPRGFFEDSYDYGAFRNLVVDPLYPGGSGRYRTASHDLASDQQVQPPERRAPNLAAVLVDGLFLHRPELSGIWDATVFLDVSFETSCRRLELRDGSDPNPQAAANSRYIRGQEIYLAACDPYSAASVVVDYNDGAAPRIVRGVP